MFYGWSCRTSQKRIGFSTGAVAIWGLGASVLLSCEHVLRSSFGATTKSAQWLGLSRRNKSTVAEIHAVKSTFVGQNVETPRLCRYERSVRTLLGAPGLTTGNKDATRGCDDISARQR